MIERILPESDIGQKEYYDRIGTLLMRELKELSADPDLVAGRYDRFRRIGRKQVKEKP